MTRYLSLTALLFILALLAIPPVQGQPGAFRPPLLDCGRNGDVDIICGVRAPEDFEVTPDGRYLVIANFGQGEDHPIDLYEFATGEFSDLGISADPQSGWGDPACTDSIGDQVGPHGLSLTQRDNGDWQFYVVNHNIRESMEMYELEQNGDTWHLMWHGCVIAEVPYNDVSALPDGSYVATRPTAFLGEGDDVFSGEPTGDVARWSAEDGEEVLPGTEIGYPNGVLVSEDQRYAYISGWTTSDFHTYDLEQQRVVARVDLGFMPDNLTWTPDGRLMAAGVKGVAGNCPADSDNPCLQGFEVVVIDPATTRITRVFDNQGRALINGVSVAIEVNGDVYVGAFQEERMVRFSRTPGVLPGP